MAETKYRNKPFTEFDNYYIIYYEGNNMDALKDWLFHKKTISFLGPYRSLDYAKKECKKINRGSIIYYSDKKENVFNNDCKNNVQNELMDWACNNSYINTPILK